MALSLQIKTTHLDTVKSEITTLTIHSNRNVLLMGTKGRKITEVDIILL